MPTETEIKYWILSLPLVVCSKILYPTFWSGQVALASRTFAGSTVACRHGKLICSDKNLKFCKIVRELPDYATARTLFAMKPFPMRFFLMEPTFTGEGILFISYIGQNLKLYFPWLQLGGALLLLDLRGVLLLIVSSADGDEAYLIADDEVCNLPLVGVEQ